MALFHFHEKKTGVSFAPVFQPLLGPIDDAAQTILLSRLTDAVPVATDAQRVFFEPDFSPVKNKSKETVPGGAGAEFSSPASGCRRGFFSLPSKYGKKDSEPLGGLFAAIRARMHDLADGTLYEQLARVYEFRHGYIAHQKAEVTLEDVELTRKALRDWIEALTTLFRASTTGL